MLTLCSAQIIIQLIWKLFPHYSLQYVIAYSYALKLFKKNK